MSYDPLPALTGGPFKYKAYAADSLKKSIKLARCLDYLAPLQVLHKEH